MFGEFEKNFGKKSFVSNMDLVQNFKEKQILFPFNKLMDIFLLIS